MNVNGIIRIRKYIKYLFVVFARVAACLTVGSRRLWHRSGIFFGTALVIHNKVRGYARVCAGIARRDRWNSQRQIDRSSFIL
jgi:hypothetical protein